MTPGSEIPRPWRPLRAAAPRRLTGAAPGLVPLLFLAGCASWHRPLPIPPEVSDAAVTARVLISPDLNVNPAETVVKPGDPSQRLPDPSPSGSPEAEPTTFALGDAIAFALRNNPRLRSARAAIERARGQEQVAFAPFLPQIDILGQYGVVSDNLAPGIPGSDGIPPGDHARDPQLRANRSGAAMDAVRLRADRRPLPSGGRTGTHRRTPARPGRPDRGVRRGRRLPGRPPGPRIPPGARGRRPPGRGDPGRHAGPAQGRRRADARTCCVPRCNCRRAARRSSWPGKGSSTRWPA